MLDVFMIPIAKLGIDIEFVWADLPENSKDHAVAYGLRKSVNDQHASIKRSDFPAGPVGDEQYKSVVLAKSMARVNAYKTGVGLPNGPKDELADLVSALKSNPGLIAEIAARAAKDPMLAAALVAMLPADDESDVA